MRLHRFIGEFDFSKTTVETTDENLINQLKNVLRLKTGDLVSLCDNKENDADAEIAEVKQNTVKFKILKVRKNENESAKHIVLCCSLLKRENFEWVVQKTTEIGVKEIIPIICERTVKTGFNQERLQKIVKEAAEQSRRGRMPTLNERLTFDQALKRAKQNDTNLLFDQKGEEFKNLNIERLKDTKIGIFVGPEGGFVQEEIENAKIKMKNVTVMNLGKLTLRAETAAVVATYLALHDSGYKL